MNVYYQTSYNPTAATLTPPPTPSHKRSRDDFESSYSTLKRAQFHQIHSQEHLNTVNMMMQASRQNKYLSEPATVGTEESSVEQELQTSNTSQRAYWPVISRVRG